jgi:hypothetical protein
VYSTPNINRVIVSRRMRWVGHVACAMERRGAHKFWWGYLRERNHLEDPGVDGTVLNGIFKKWDGGIKWIALA